MGIIWGCWKLIDGKMEQGGESWTLVYRLPVRSLIR